VDVHDRPPQQLRRQRAAAGAQRGGRRA
jgi:hypothetical protein